MKVAILGAGGCFAQNFANYLREHDVQCFGLGRSYKPPAFWMVSKDYRYRVVHLVDQLGKAMALLDEQAPEVVVNFAAQGEGAASFGEHAPDFYRTNVWGLAALAEALRQRDYLRQFIHVGSSEVYGSNDYAVDETLPLRASSPYALSKACFDQHLQIMYRIHGFPVTIVRPSNCYTPGQQLHRIIPKAIICALTDRKLPLQGGGWAKKSYLHATDLSDAIHRIILDPKPGRIYNVGPSEPIAIRDLVWMIANSLKMSYAKLVEEVPDRVGQDGCYWLCSGAIRRELGWEPEISLERGIANMRRWIGEFPELLEMNLEYSHAL